MCQPPVLKRTPARRRMQGPVVALVLALPVGAPLSRAQTIELPRLDAAVKLDGDLREWKELAHHDGAWDIYRVRASSWFDPKRNRLTRHRAESAPAADLTARYYMGWDEKFLYLGAEVTDNVNDVDDPKHEPKRWYFKDAICWFIEAPRDSKSESFGEGDNAFCFVADSKRPPYAAWWRHGDGARTYIEEPLGADAVTWALRPGKQGDFVLEARIAMAATFGKSDRAWRAPRVGDQYSVEIVHTDPDGGGYGGHLLIYGNGDDDATWTPMRLTGPRAAVERLPE